MSINYLFTVNNYTDSHLESLAALSVRYLVFGKEIAPTTGTPHLQCFVIFHTTKRLTGAIKAIPFANNLQIAKGSSIQNRTYCIKDGDFVEVGECPQPPGPTEKRRWDVILKAAQDGVMELIPDDLHFKCPKLIASHRTFSTDDTEEKMLWYYGPPGTGKSKKAREENPGCYLKMCNKWWDDYAGQEVVLIEDIDKKHEKLLHHIKIWADRYSFPAEIKGGKIDIRPKKIIITSNYHPEEIWESERDSAPIMRRFICTDFNPVYDKYSVNFNPRN